jgi:ABC-type multidrug transport system permease subunit
VIPCWVQIIFSYPQDSEWFWGPLILCSDEYGNISLEIRQLELKLTIHHLSVEVKNGTATETTLFLLSIVYFSILSKTSALLFLQYAAYTSVLYMYLSLKY